MDDERPEPPKTLAYHDGKAPSLRGAEVSELATASAWAAVGFSTVLWGAVIVVRSTRAYVDGGFACCVIFPVTGLTLLSLLLWFTSDRRGPPAVATVAVVLLGTFWIWVFAAADR